MNWIYQHNEVTRDTLPEGAVGFIYRIVHIPTGKYYIGKKQLESTRNVKLSKKALAILKEARTGKGGRLPSKKRVVSESDWQNYYSSNAEIKQMVSDGKAAEFSREIIKYCFSLKSLGYWETYYLFTNNVLADDNCYNSNISGRYFRKDLI